MSGLIRLKLLALSIVLTTLTATVNGQSIKKYDSFETYQHLLNKNNDTTYVINFWATWCAPCVKEIPEFKKAYRAYKGKKVKFILTSMDFGGNVRSRVQSFLKRHQVPSGMEVVILDDPDSNSWINKVNKSWSGAIPATLVYTRDEREFYEKELKFKELKNIITTKSN